MLYVENTERGTGIEKGSEWSNVHFDRTGPTELNRESGPPRRWAEFFETFPVGPKRSIQFQTEISGKFG